MARYHLKEDGALGLCKASLRDCPLSAAARHGDFESPQEAQNWAEKILATQHPEALAGLGKLPAPAKNMAAQLGDPDFHAKGFARARNSYGRIQEKLKELEDLKTLSAEEVEEITASMDVAWHLHAEQVRKGTKIPYIVHPLESMERLLSYGIKDRAILQAMALHDCMEDSAEIYCKKAGIPVVDKEQAQDYTQASVEASFGEDTGALVEALSTQIAADRGSDEIEQNRLYQEDVKARTEKSFGALIGTFSDFMDNAGTLRKAHFDDSERKIHLAQKYLPLINILKANARAQVEANDFPLAASKRQRFERDLTRVENDLNAILGRL